MIAIIPARGGSKGLLKKNIIDLGGKPLIAHTIEAALKSKNIAKIFLSTDDEKIAEVSSQYDIEIPFMRPIELAGDRSKAIDNYLFTIKLLNQSYGHKIEDFIVLQPTSPFRQAMHIDAAIKLFNEKKADSVVSVTDYNHPVQWAKVIDTRGRITDYLDSKNDDNKNRQELSPVYLPNGAIFILKYSILKKYYSYYSKNTYAYRMDHLESVDIDTEYDYEFAKYLWERKFEKH